MAEMEISSGSNAENQATTDQPATKKRRNQPGMPDPEAEVMALSPRTLLATNRFVCEICNKGFQREQNLQLHRRGHNLPWKLRQRTGNEVKKRVYVCPEVSCIHHNPARALGDLTGIKKHFCRKHGEKKYKCERCTKIYAVQSDWKAHMKICGSREYRCDCGTLFARKDSFITHRAFCDALAQESTRSHSQPQTLEAQAVNGVSSSSPPPPLTPSTGVLSPVLSIQSSAELPENQTVHFQAQTGKAALSTSITTTTTVAATTSGGSFYNNNVNSGSGVFASMFVSSTLSELAQPSCPPSSYSDLLSAMAGPECSTIDPMSLSLSSSLYLSSSYEAPLFPTASQDSNRHYASTPQPALSATALLQKAAQIGATSTNSSLLRGLGLTISSSSDPQDKVSMAASSITGTAPFPSHWNSRVQLENSSFASNGSSSLNDLMIGPSTSLFSNKPTTLDFLGLGMGASEASPGGFSAFLTTIGGGLNAAAASVGGGASSSGDAWDDPSSE